MHAQYASVTIDMRVAPISLKESIVLAIKEILREHLNFSRAGITPTHLSTLPVIINL